MWLLFCDYPFADVAEVRLTNGAWPGKLGSVRTNRPSFAFQICARVPRRLKLSITPLVAITLHKRHRGQKAFIGRVLLLDTDPNAVWRLGSLHEKQATTCPALSQPNPAVWGTRISPIARACDLQNEQEEQHSEPKFK